MKDLTDTDLGIKAVGSMEYKQVIKTLKIQGYNKVQLYTNYCIAGLDYDDDYNYSNKNSKNYKQNKDEE